MSWSGTMCALSLTGYLVQGFYFGPYRAHYKGLWLRKFNYLDLYLSSICLYLSSYQHSSKYPHILYPHISIPGKRRTSPLYVLFCLFKKCRLERVSCGFRIEHTKDREFLLYCVLFFGVVTHLFCVHLYCVLCLYICK